MLFGDTVMSDRAAKPVPSLAVVEKRQAARPTGGCVGILFQLFDWHRRLAKKKLFSRKLLPPARPKQAMRSFKVDEKIPVAKFHYIADENTGGFPSSRETKAIDDERKHEMGTPSLVARLMGLESMPSGKREKVKNSSSHEKCNDKTSKSAVTHHGFGREEMADNGQMRHERPQKLQKTGFSERQAVTRFGAEALQIKGVLSRSRKPNHSKHASLLKSPRISSSRNGCHKSRLLDAATRILEPGSQAKNIAKCALTYTESKHYVEVIVDSSAAERTPYTNCGTGHRKTNISQYGDDQRVENAPAASCSSEFSNAACHDPVSTKTASVFTVSNRENVFSYSRQEESLSLKDCKRLPLECPQPWHLPTNKSAPQRDGRPSVATLKSGRVASAANSVSGTKDFVALNRSLSSQTRPRVLTKAEGSSIDATRRSRGRKDDSVSHLRSPAQRMRTDSSSEAARSVNICNTTIGKPRKVTSSKTSDSSSVISFTFNSPLKQKSSSYTEAEDSSSSKSSSVRESDDSRDLSSEGSDKKPPCRDHLALRGDALGALLEQKLKELMSQVDDESTSGSTTPKRSTAMILQDLIAALTSDATLSRDCNMLDADNSFQFGSRKEGLLVESPSHTNYFSPGSVLDAPFSNDSCVSSNLDDSSGLKLPTDFTDFSCDPLQTLVPDGDLQDSATTLQKAWAHPNITINLISCIDRVLSRLNLGGVELSETKLSYAKDVILHSEMLCSGTADSCWSDKEIITSPLLLDELESLAISAWASIGWFDGIADLKDGKQLKSFLFDCLLECIDTKYHPHSNFGYRRWRRLPSCLKKEILFQDVEEGLKMWTALSGMSVDEMIEWEMSHSLGKWVDFGIEEFENGVEIESDILQNIMEEIVSDILPCSRILSV